MLINEKKNIVGYTFRMYYKQGTYMTLYLLFKIIFKICVKPLQSLKLIYYFAF